MFAIISSGGKQYKVEKNSILRIEKIVGNVGETIEISDILLAHSEQGVLNAGAALVKAEILEQKLDKKVIVFKKKRRTNYRRKKGHRQPLTVIKINDIVINDNSFQE